MRTMKALFCIITLMLMAANARPTETAHPQVRQKAQSAYNNGNWQDAYKLYRQLVFETQNDPNWIGKDFSQALQCLQQLNRLNELDQFREAVIQQHAANWRLLVEAARSYNQNIHWGYLVAGKFHREQHRGGGKIVNASGHGICR